MKTINNLLRSSFLILTSLMLMISCSSNGSSGSGSSPTGGIEGTGRVLSGDTFSLGSISSTGKLGSISVNGVEYETNNANIKIDGAEGTSEDLKVGMVVQITSDIVEDADSQQALDILYESNIKGMIDSIDLDNNQLVVAGQLVKINSLTVYEGIAKEDLAIGNIVVVSGFKAADGGVESTLIRFISNSFVQGSESIVVISEINSLNTISKTFLIGDLSVAYNGAEFDGLKESDLKDGLNVKVVSTLNISNSLMIADRIQFTTESLAGNEGHKVEIAGLINKIISTTEIEVNGQPIILNDLVVFENGSIENIVLNTRLEVDGVLDSQGNIIAKEIEFVIAGSIEFEASIQTINASSIVVLGVLIEVEDSTLFVDEVNQGVEFDFSSLILAERIDILARFNDDGVLVATRIARKVPDEVVDPSIEDIQAEILNLSRPTFTIAGVPVMVNEGVTVFEGIAGDPQDADVFFSLIQNGSLVEVEGTFVDGVLVAEVISIVVP